MRTNCISVRRAGGSLPATSPRGAAAALPSAERGRERRSRFSAGTGAAAGRREHAAGRERRDRARRGKGREGKGSGAGPAAPIPAAPIPAAAAAPSPRPGSYPPCSREGRRRAEAAALPTWCRAPATRSRSLAGPGRGTSGPVGRQELAGGCRRGSLPPGRRGHAAWPRSRRREELTAPTADRTCFIALPPQPPPGSPELGAERGGDRGGSPRMLRRSGASLLRKPAHGEGARGERQLGLRGRQAKAEGGGRLPRARPAEPLWPREGAGRCRLRREWELPQPARRVHRAGA